MTRVEVVVILEGIQEYSFSEELFRELLLAVREHSHVKLIVRDLLEKLKSFSVLDVRLELVKVLTASLFESSVFEGMKILLELFSLLENSDEDPDLQVEVCYQLFLPYNECFHCGRIGELPSLGILLPSLIRLPACVNVVRLVAWIGWFYEDHFYQCRELLCEFLCANPSEYLEGLIVDLLRGMDGDVEMLAVVYG